MRMMFGKLLASAALAVAASVGVAHAAPLTSNVMGTFFEPLTVTTISGDAFDLNHLNLALGPQNPLGHDTMTLVGTFADLHTETLSFSVGYPFQTRAVNWTGLTSVVFQPLDNFSGYVVFDDIDYATGPGGHAVTDFEDLTAGVAYANSFESGGLHFEGYYGVIYGPDAALDFPIEVPEPATWAMMLLGFFGMGATLRSARRKAALA